MASIRKRKRRDGTTAYLAEVRIMRDGQTVFKARKTLNSHRAAAAWAAGIEAEWETAAADPKPLHTVGELIKVYRERMEAIKPLGRTRRKVLEAIAKTDLARVRASDLREQDLVRFCQQRRAGGAGQATVMVDVSAVSSVFRDARTLLGLDLNADVFRLARPSLVRLGLIAKPKARNRRLQGDELDRLLAHFRLRIQHAAAFLPMADIVEFAIYSCMRQGEICSLLWADFDAKARTVVVRNRKSPVQKEGNDQVIPLLGAAFEVAARQPRMAERIFPFDERSVSAAFTRSCRQLGIAGLRFHDLRREGATRLFEMGYSVPEVATVTGHRDLNILWNVYTRITPEHLHRKYRNDKS